MVTFRPAVVLPALLVVAACGARTPLKTSRLTEDAGSVGDASAGDSGTVDTSTEDSSVGPESGAGCASARDSCDPDNHPCCGGLACYSDTCCGATGASCSQDADCCLSDCYGGFCGQPPSCTSEGAGCDPNDATKCCSNLCSNGVCACRPDGMTCTSPSQCCSYKCTNDMCGQNACHARGPSPCDACTAVSCCSQLSACELEPMCRAFLSCFTGCEMAGGSTVSCAGTQCAMLSDNLAVQLRTCADQMCPMDCPSE